MSTMLTITIVLGALATLLFVAGYVRGTFSAIRNHASNLQPVLSGEQPTFTWSIAFAVCASIVVIGLIGVSPVFFYVPPLLVIGTAAVNGYAFFLDKDG